MYSPAVPASGCSRLYKPTFTQRPDLCPLLPSPAPRSAIRDEACRRSPATEVGKWFYVFLRERIRQWFGAEQVRMPHIGHIRATCLQVGYAWKETWNYSPAELAARLRAEARDAD